MESAWWVLSFYSAILITKLLVNFSNGFYVNDALSLLKVMQSGEDAPNVLKEYSLAFDNKALFEFGELCGFETYSDTLEIFHEFAKVADGAKLKIDLADKLGKLCFVCLNVTHMTRSCQGFGRER